MADHFFQQPVLVVMMVKATIGEKYIMTFNTHHTYDSSSYMGKSAVCDHGHLHPTAYLRHAI